LRRTTPTISNAHVGYYNTKVDVTAWADPRRRTLRRGAMANGGMASVTPVMVTGTILTPARCAIVKGPRLNFPNRPSRLRVPSGRHKLRKDARFRSHAGARSERKEKQQKIQQEAKCSARNTRQQEAHQQDKTTEQHEHELEHEHAKTAMK